MFVGEEVTDVHPCFRVGPATHTMPEHRASAKERHELLRVVQRHLEPHVPVVEIRVAPGVVFGYGGSVAVGDDGLSEVLA